MRGELDRWRFSSASEAADYRLCRFLIAVEELRVRLAPERYPNIEISDEGHLWFNVKTPIGVAEVLAFPFGFSESESPSIAVSFPRRAEDVSPDLLTGLCRIQGGLPGTSLFANKTASTKEEILSAFSHERPPPAAGQEELY